MLPSNFYQDPLPAWRPGPVRDTGPAFVPATGTRPCYQCLGCSLFFAGMG